MAKGSQFWGQASGKLGEQVLYRAGGEQRARSYTKNVKNPKTLAQMKNRITMANLVAVFNQLKPILKESFPNRPTNQSGFNAFVSANKNKQTPVLDPGMIALGYSVPYNMNISKGSIQFPEWGASDAINEADSFHIKAVVDGSAFQGKQGKEQLALLLANYGIPSDAKVTIVVANDEDEGFSLTHATGDFVDIVNVAKSLGLRNPSIAGVDESNPNIIEVTLGSALTTKMIGVIISYTDATGKLQVTTSRIKKGSMNGPDITTYLPGGEVYESVLNASGYTQDSVLSTK